VSRRKLSIAAIFVILIFNITAVCESQQEKISPTLEQGIAQYKHENYEEALVLLKKARDEASTSTIAAFYLGLTYKQLQNYDAAIPNLREAVTMNPKIKGALIELIDCLYQLNRIGEAREWIAEAEKEGIRPAQVAFLKGLILMKDNEEEGAVEAFENAKTLDPSMAQSCDYQIGVAHLKMKNFGQAKDVFQKLVLVDPNSNMANFANEYIDSLSKREEAMKPFKLTFGAAWQYDDNVVLKPSDTTVSAAISDKADTRQVYTANAEYDKKFCNDKYGVKGQYFFYYGKQTDLGFYDVLSNTFVIQPSAYFKNGLLTFPLGYNHTLVNDKAYLSSPTASGVYNHMFGKSNMAQAFIKYQYKDYLWTPSSDDEDRDGNDLGGGLGWYTFFAKNKGFVNVRYSMNQEFTQGNNWDYFGNRVSGTVLIPVLKQLNVTFSGDMFFQNFDHTHSFFNVKRHDQVYTLSTLAAYKFYKESELQFQYTYVKDNSNISLYDYHRNIFSVGVQVKF